MTLRSMSLFALCLFASTAAIGAEPERDPATRYRLQATLTPAPAESQDGRYAIQATAGLSGVDEQRFLVKGVAASCAAVVTDIVFDDSFEAP